MINKINKYINQNKKSIIFFTLLFFTLFYFIYSVSILWDSAHYMTYVSILEGNSGWSTWDVVRGPTFPIIIFLSNILFGKTVQGLLILTYLFYLVMLVIIYIMLNKVLEKNKYKNFIILITVLLIIANPIIYGYYHALLTEFVAMTISILACYLSWKYIEEIDKYNKIYTKLLYILLFCFLIVFSWFLKQPYVSITLFPLIIAMMISIFSNLSLKNVLMKIIIIISFFSSLLIGIKAWNNFLSSKNIDTNVDRNPTVSVGEGFINSIKNVEIENSDKFIIFDVENMLLTKDEKKEMAKKLENNEKFKIINIYSNKNIIEQYFYNSNTIKMKDAISIFMKIFINHPMLVIDTYFTNYLAIGDVYKITTEDNIGYVATNELDLKFCAELCSIGLKPYTYTSNIYYMTVDRYELVKNYEQNNYTPKIINFGMRKLGIIYLITYKLSILLLPIFLILSIVYRIINKRKELSSKIDLVIILLGYSFLHIMLHVTLGATIDRYAIPAYLPSIMGIGILTYTFMVSKRKRISKKYKQLESN